jgi:hypothetical protein
MYTVTTPVKNYHLQLSDLVATPVTQPKKRSRLGGERGPNRKTVRDQTPDSACELLTARKNARKHQPLNVSGTDEQLKLLRRRASVNAKKRKANVEINNAGRRRSKKFKTTDGALGVTPSDLVNMPSFTSQGDQPVLEIALPSAGSNSSAWLEYLNKMRFSEAGTYVATVSDRKDDLESHIKAPDHVTPEMGQIQAETEHGQPAANHSSSLSEQIASDQQESKGSQQQSDAHQAGDDASLVDMTTTAVAQGATEDTGEVSNEIEARISTPQLPTPDNNTEFELNISTSVGNLDQRSADDKAGLKISEAWDLHAQFAAEQQGADSQSVTVRNLMIVPSDVSTQPTTSLPQSFVSDQSPVEGGPAASLPHQPERFIFGAPGLGKASANSPCQETPLSPRVAGPMASPLRNASYQEEISTALLDGAHRALAGSNETPKYITSTMSPQPNNQTMARRMLSFLQNKPVNRQIDMAKVNMLAQRLRAESVSASSAVTSNPRSPSLGSPFAERPSRCHQPTDFATSPTFRRSLTNSNGSFAAENKYNHGIFLDNSVLGTPTPIPFSIPTRQALHSAGAGAGARGIYNSIHRANNLSLDQSPPISTPPSILHSPLASNNNWKKKDGVPFPSVYVPPLTTMTSPSSAPAAQQLRNRQLIPRTFPFPRRSSPSDFHLGEVDALATAAVAAAAPMVYTNRDNDGNEMS